MQMTVTLDNVTTDKALRLLSALEFGHLLEDTKIEMNQKDAVEVAEEYLKSLLPQKSSQIETIREPVKRVKLPQDAGDCDLFVDDFQGFHLQAALDAWFHGHGIKEAYLPYPLPRIGNMSKRNLVTVPYAGKLLGHKSTGLYSFIYTGSVESAHLRGSQCYWLTREQVAILRLAQEISQATGRKRLSPKIIRQATCAFLAAFPEYMEEARLLRRAA